MVSPLSAFLMIMSVLFFSELRTCLSGLVKLFLLLDCLLDCWKEVLQLSIYCLMGAKVCSGMDEGDE